VARVLIFALFAAGLLARLHAHDPGISRADGVLSDGRLELTVGFAPADAQELLPPAARPTTKWTEVEFEAAKTQLEALAPQFWEARLDGNVVPPIETQVQLRRAAACNCEGRCSASCRPVTGSS
jgi:hypothetical protein